MTNDERDDAIRGLIRLCLHYAERLREDGAQIAALRIAVQQLIPATEAEFEVVVENIRRRLPPAHPTIEDAENAALRHWLEKFEGPSQ